MHGKLLSLGLAFLLTTFAFAEPAPEFDEIHFAASPGPGVLAVTVIAREPAIWRLFPEEVKIEHKKNDLEYTLSYSSQSSLQSLIRSARDDKNTSETCKTELGAILNTPKTKISDDKLTQTIYIVLDDDHPERLTLRTNGGVKILNAEALRSETDLDTAEKGEMQPWTRAVYVNLEYKSGYNVTFNTSDLVVTEGATKGSYQVTAQKTGLAPLKAFIADGLLSALCTEGLSIDFWSLPVDTAEPKNRSDRNVVVVIAMPKDVPTKVELKMSPGFSFKAIKPLE